MNKNVKNSLIILVAFLFYYLLLKEYLFSIRNLIAFVEPRYIRSLCFQLICLVPLILALFAICKPKDILASIGLSCNFALGMGIAFLCTLPMTVGNIFVGTFNKDITSYSVLSSIVYAGFFEELAFRGFLFGLLFRYTRWGFIPASLVGALFFGAGHLYQGSDLLSALATFGVTALGAIWFSWMYVEWQNNLWVSIGMHMLMNASWILFSVSPTAAGGLVSNIVRGVTIVAVIGVTILYKKKHNLPYLVNRTTLW